MERSEKILQGLGNQYYRATLKSMGFTTEDLKRPASASPATTISARWPSG